jgi:hypothetical protein
LLNLLRRPAHGRWLNETTTRHRGGGGLRRRWLRGVKHRIDRADRDRHRNSADGDAYRRSDRSTHRSADRATDGEADRTAEHLRRSRESLWVQLLRRGRHQFAAVELLRLLQLHPVVLAIDEGLRRGMHRWDVLTLGRSERFVFQPRG